jgi:hypothetical protein
MTNPLFSDEGPEYYQRAYEHNRQFALPSATNYQTVLTPGMETQFRDWVEHNHILFDPSAPIVDYDMRGYWQALMSGQAEPPGVEPGGQTGFPDTYKTPYDTTFSNESRYATGDNPFRWQGDDLIDTRNGQLVFGRQPDMGFAPSGFDTMIDHDEKITHHDRVRYPPGRDEHRALPTGPRSGQTNLPGIQDMPGGGYSVPTAYNDPGVQIARQNQNTQQYYPTPEVSPGRTEQQEAPDDRHHQGFPSPAPRDHQWVPGSPKNEGGAETVGHYEAGLAEGRRMAPQFREKFLEALDNHLVNTVVEQLKGHGIQL